MKLNLSEEETKEAIDVTFRLAAEGRMSYADWLKTAEARKIIGDGFRESLEQPSGLFNQIKHRNRKSK